MVVPKRGETRGVKASMFREVRWGMEGDCDSMWNTMDGVLEEIERSSLVVDGERFYF